MTMQRYCMQYDGFEECVIEEAYDRGAWVKASDAEAALAEKDARIKELEHRFEEIRVVLSRGRDATGCSDEYFRGMYNGIEWSLCCIEEREANYKDVCEKSEEVHVLQKWDPQE